MAIERSRNYHNLHPNRGNNGNFGEHTKRIRPFHECHAGVLMVEVPLGSTFEDHDRGMREFRKSHVSDLKVKVSRRDLKDKMWPLLVTDTLKETGGSRLPKETLDLSTLIPIQKITACRFSSN